MIADIDIADADELLARYSRGELSGRELRDLTGLQFGEILSELSRRDLNLPVVDTRVFYNDKQKALYDKIFSPVTK